MSVCHAGISCTILATGLHCTDGLVLVFTVLVSWDRIPGGITSVYHADLRVRFLPMNHTASAALWQSNISRSWHLCQGA
ncbi:unnamed protein product [Gongylonema pulchrum]|uniref:Secreted protein n=1 Tax=Gongylonema pulchrum TaxID=637853 RepID=A0A183DCW1_9BILA|nr:unnamed protein product [Gongylonema pulchrum]